MRQLPEAPLLDGPPQLLDGQIEAILVAGSHLDALLLCHGDDLVGILHGHSHWLLDDDVDSSRNALKRDLGVLATLGGDANELDLGVSVEHGHVVRAPLGPGELPAVGLLEHNVELGRVDIADGDEL